MEDIVQLASDYELAAEEFKHAQARFEDARTKLAAALSAPAARPAARPASQRVQGGGKKQARPDWHAAQEALLKNMRKGEHYRGDELAGMAGVSVSASRFIANVRNPLLGKGAIKKRHHSGKPWRKGMSPKSVRWVKA